ncbi:unnamed protein product [Aureobasidium pullulans]|nr:unnamed protein product [Aureobasidium pullulans]
MENQMPRFTTVALNHATPSFYCSACGYMLNSKPTMHTHIWQNHENALDVLTQFQFDTNAHIKKAYRCHGCNIQPFFHAKRLIQHIQSSHPQNVVEYTTRLDEEIRVWKNNPTRPNLPCSLPPPPARPTHYYCPLRCAGLNQTLDRNVILNHIIAEHSDARDGLTAVFNLQKPFICPLGGCDEKFHTEAGLRDHSAGHERDAAEALLALYG